MPLAPVVDEAIERILGGQLRPQPAATEAEWHELWTSRALGSEAPIVMAVTGGALADRLPWVFVSGYQAASRRAFPELPASPGWACFAASEDREGKLPGASLREIDGCLELSGAKTWIAASDHVAQLVVTVGAGEDQRLVVVDRDRAGVTIESYDRAGFLGDMSQGRATFEGVAVQQELTGSTSRWGFGAGEPLHVLIALNAFMLSHTIALGGPAALVGRALSSVHAAAKLAERELTADIVPYGLAGLDAHTQVTAEEFEALIGDADAELRERWSTDRRLVSMFSAGIGRRAEALAGQDVSR